VKWPTIRWAEIFAARFRGPEPDANPLPARGDVDGVFFRLRRREGRKPLVVARGDAGAGAATRFAQLAVLLGGGSTRIAFHWIGAVDAAASAELNAAGVVLVDAAEPVRRATRLRPAWVCVEFGVTDSASRLSEAMALGLPCIAWDTPAHRALIEPGTNGLLCDSEEGLLTGAASLIDSSALRLRIGQAARHEALRRAPGEAAAPPAAQAVGGALPLTSGALPLGPGR
jgi:glycosyltransferase involved in cell wall biosynthesis